MEENVIKLLEEKINDLEHEKSEYEEEFNQIQGRLEYTNGKFEKSSELMEIESDIENIKQLIKENIDEKANFEKWTKQKNIEKEKIEINEKKKESLLKDEEQCKEAIDKVSGQYSLKEGKIVKTNELIEYKKDLKKIQSEIKKLNSIIKRGQTREKNISKKIDEVIEKYSKQLKEKEDRDKYDRDWEAAIEEDKRIDEERYDKDWEAAIEENKKIDEERHDRDWEAAIEENKRIDEERYDRDWKEAIKENKIRDVEALKNKILRNFKATRASKSNEKKVNSIKEKDVKIIIGRKKGQILINGEEYKISQKVIKTGVNLDILDVVDIIKGVYNNNLDNKQEAFIMEAIRNNYLDPIVVNAISLTKMNNDTKKQIMKDYLEDLIQIKKKKAFKAKSHITYDMEDLSKSSILGRILGRELNEQEKVEILKNAKGEAYRYGISETKGEYKPSLGSRLLSFITRNQVPTLDSAINIDKAHKIASEYDKIAYSNGKLRDKEDFKKKLKEKVDNKYPLLKPSEKKELSSLAKSQEKQNQR